MDFVLFIWATMKEKLTVIAVQHMSEFYIIFGCVYMEDNGKKTNVIAVQHQ